VVGVLRWTLPKQGGLKQSTFCMARRKTMITMGSIFCIDKR
jgi:hypothetical protein